MIEIKINFTTIAEAAAFMATFPRFDSALPVADKIVSAPPKDAAEKPKASPKSAKAEAPAPTLPSASPATAAPETPKIEYPPLGAKIAELVAAGKAAKIKEVFATLRGKDGTVGVKRGSDVHDDDLQSLAGGLAAIENGLVAVEKTEESMA